MINKFFFCHNRNRLIIFFLILNLSGCFFRGKKEIIPDGDYFKSISTAITKTLVGDKNKEAPERVVIVDIVNTNGKVSILGRFITFKLFESFLKETKSALVPRGEILTTLGNIGIKPSSEYGKESLTNLADELKASVIILGELVDLGVKIELNVKMIDAKTGEVLSAASAPIERKETVINLYESF